MSGPALALACAAVLATDAFARQLSPETEAEWRAYVSAVEQRLARELATGRGVLAGGGEAPAALDGRVVLSGSIVVKSSVEEAGGRAREVPNALVHHWRGVVFIPGTTLDQVLDRVTNPDARAAPQDVLESRVLDRRPGALRLFLRLQRSQIVTVVYDTEHDVRYVRHGPLRASSRSVATRIAEVADAGTTRERDKPPGQDRGFLWRLNSYWRYEAVAGGVVVECESISLSRTIPAVLRTAVGLMVDHVARSSMERTLASLRARLTAATLRSTAGS
jgi:hypothetical protein